MTIWRKIGQKENDYEMDFIYNAKWSSDLNIERCFGINKCRNIVIRKPIQVYTSLIFQASSILDALITACQDKIVTQAHLR